MSDLGPLPHLGYTDSALDRAAEHRADDAFLDKAWDRADAGVYLIAGELVLMQRQQGETNPLFPTSAVRYFGEPRGTVFLGLDRNGAARFGIALDAKEGEALKANPEYVVTDLRTIAVQGLVDPVHLPPLAEAKAMLHWHLGHSFCSRCGTATKSKQAGWKRECPQCKAEHFPRTDPVVIMLAIDGDKCLLGRQTRFVTGMWSCLAGFCEPGETLEEATRREVLEEAGIHCGKVKYFRSQPWPFPMNLMIGVHAEATSRDITVDRAELEDARWFTRQECADMLMRRHTDGLGTPPPVAIAHHIIRDFVDHGADVLS
ncbi:NADH pyrophosphatase [Variibacter gotjawalensis]|uniref:NAD(+) diphosphatase n=1 Tax=Variibacter gotjawalensis TaxID=1333996 RepID=A0A0S3PPP3_9BRAD|nr:NAD(+) diphosphatase [Variibacter gotjawalensis]NIK48209.1 NAD+ diphosphatase [Variibacter gotjawalensis]RZS50080.1 NAD+ diphosphatase [Variibacter gotjawalensis]BAT57911.1 NADH pyrophosphatase [Variibacter gotjawalensis]